jgi:ESCRT-I complex subunit VPS28
MYDNLANLYSIIKTTEALEKAYVRDAISAKDYKAQCTKLITQFKAAQTLTKESAPDIRKFMEEYRLDCKAAYQRLVVEGVPISGGQADDSARTIAETVQFFITAMDSLKLGMLAVDQVQPLLGDLLEALSKVSNLPPDWEGKVRVQSWLSKLHTMQAHEELDEDQGRQMLFDLDNAYTEFHKSLA